MEAAWPLLALPGSMNRAMEMNVPVPPGFLVTAMRPENHGRTVMLRLMNPSGYALDLNAGGGNGDSWILTDAWGEQEKYGWPEKVPALGLRTVIMKR